MASKSAVTCPRCGRMMTRIGPVGNICYTSDPSQYPIRYVCHDCRVRIQQVECLVVQEYTFNDYEEVAW